MKQCPQCREHFENEQKFCESDGTLLIDETALLRNALYSSTGASSESPDQTYAQSQRMWSTIAIGVLIGVIISLSTYVFVVMPAADREGKSSHPESARRNTSDRLTTQPAIIRSESLPVPTAEASREEIASETASPSPAAAAVEPAEDASASLNNGPISTNRQDGEKHGRTVIKLKTGVLVEADAAWQDRSGIWYRQGALVSYVERERIESIGEPPRPKSSPTEITKP
jgi:hypothetical protein